MTRQGRVRAWTSCIASGLAACLICGCEPAANTLPPGPEAMALSAIKEAAARMASEAAIDFEALVAAGETTPVEDLVATLKSQTGVADATIGADGSTIVIELDDGEIISLFTDEKNRAQWQDAGSGRRIVSDASSDGTQSVRTDWGQRKGLHVAADPVGDSFIICDETSFPQAQNACVVMNFPGQFNQDSDAITKPLERAGYNVNVVRLETFADIKALQQSLSSCGVLYISTHGGVGQTRQGKNANILATEIEIAQGAALPSQMQSLLSTYSGGEVNEFLTVTGANGKSYWGLTPAFFATGTYKNTMVFVDACNSDATIPSGGEPLKDAFLDHGAGAYIGWSASISTKFSNPAVAAIFDGLAPAEIGIESMTIFTDPSDPGAGESYVPVIQVQPPTAGVEVRLSIAGTDFFRRSETQTTDSFGEATFASVPGGDAGVTDTITAVTGGADNGATVVDVSVKNDPTLPEACKLLWQNGQVSIANLKYSLRNGADASFNLVCNNPDITTTDKVVKF